MKNWNENIDLIKGNFKNTLDPTISTDIKYVATNEGYVYFNWVKEFSSQSIIGDEYSFYMSYLNLVKPSLEKGINFLKKYNFDLTNLIINTDNGMQYYHQDFIEYANKNNFKLSKKKPYKLGHNALS